VWHVEGSSAAGNTLWSSVRHVHEGEGRAGDNFGENSGHDHDPSQRHTTNGGLGVKRHQRAAAPTDTCSQPLLATGPTTGMDARLEGLGAISTCVTAHTHAHDMWQVTTCGKSQTKHASNGHSRSRSQRRGPVPPPPSPLSRGKVGGEGLRRGVVVDGVPTVGCRTPTFSEEAMNTAECGRGRTTLRRAPIYRCSLKHSCARARAKTCGAGKAGVWGTERV
jgi:hypothetical protein